MSGFSGGSFSEEHTSRYLLPFLHWFLPNAAPDILAVLHAGIRKAMHLGEYGILALLWYRALRHPEVPWQASVGLIAFGLSMLFAGVDEFHQSFVPGRGASIADVGLDSVGAAIPLLARRISRRVGMGTPRF